MIRQVAIALVVVILRTVATGQVFSFQPSSALPEFESRMSRPGTPRGGTPAAYADPSINVTYYRLNLRVVPQTSFLGGSVLVRARCTSDSISSIGLDLVNTMHVDSVLAGGHAVSFQQFQLVLIISLDRVYRQQEMVSIEVFYGGYPAATGLGSLEFSTHSGTPWVWSLSEPYGARDWWPCKDHPADKADSVDVFVTADAGLKVGSNGRLVAVTDNTDGTQTTHWAERYPIATYLVSIAVTNFAEFTDWFRYSPTDSMPVINYVLPEHLADAQANLPKVIGMLSIFSERYGLYPFVAEKYGHSEFGFGGAMEHQTMTSTTSFDETVIAHELAHQWFGDLITCASWQHLWLNEGFASYNEAVYREAMYGPSAYWSSINARMDLALKATGSLFVEDTSDVRVLFDNHLVYSKGASVLHMLRHILGDTVFFAAMKAYAGDPSLRYGVATTEDFQHVCESVSGINLGYFFREWVYGNGHPRYSVRWATASVPPGYQVTVAIDQTTSGTDPVFFAMPVDLEVRAAAFDTTVRVFHSANGEQFTFLLPQHPDTVLIDPGHWILRELVSPSAPLPVAYQLEQNYPNPFNGTTAIVYSLPHRGSYSLKIYDLLGRAVVTLADTRGDPGTWTTTWDGRDRSGNAIASGIYFYRLAGEGVALTRKMVVIR